MDISDLKMLDSKTWDSYVMESRRGNFFQLSGWKTILETYFRLETHFLYAHENERITAILPLVVIRSPILGSYVTSMPGGFCSNDQQSTLALTAQAVRITKEKRAKYLIIRDSLDLWDLPDLLVDKDHCSLVVPVDRENVMWSRLKRHEKRAIRNAIKEGLSVSDQTHRISDFYPVYLQAMRERGTPPLGRKFFLQVAKTFPDFFNLQTVIQNERMIAGGFLAPFNQTVACTWAALPRQHFHLHPSQILFWNTIMYGAKRDYQWVDLGRSQWNSGSFYFKLKFGAEPWQLYQYYYLNTISNPPRVGASREDQAEYRLFTRVWQHLPYKVTEILGYQIRRQMPFG